jgi:hypothetical protein
MTDKSKLLSNVSLIAAGIEQHRDGTAQAQAGIANISQGIMDNWFYSMRWSYGSGDNEVSGVSNLGDMFKHKSNGRDSADSKYLPAMYRAVADNFGIEGAMSSADKMAFQRAFTIAAARFAEVPVEIVQANVKRKGKTVKIAAVQVPASVAYDLADDSGAPNDLGRELMERVKSNLELQSAVVPDDAKLFEQAQALKVNCVGGQHPVFGKVPSATDIANRLHPSAVGAGVMQAKGNRNKSGNNSKFRDSLAFVSKCMDEVLSESCDTDFAPCNEAEKELRGLAEKIAAYFAA